ncbi:MAG: hypothetical protein CMO44_02505 [Verrucomicrobiales bacterium]|nr:hypothetical protein [Verrucomicrobiales bacterium]
MELIYYSHGFGILFLSLFFIMVFNGIWFWWIWVFLVLAPFSYTPVIYYRRRRKKTGDEETLSLVEQKEVKAFYDNVIQF